MTHLKERYFEWMYDTVCNRRFSKGNSYRKLLIHLHDIAFTWLIPKDANRAEDGKDLRWRFAYKNGLDIYDELDGPCSVLELLIALSIRCEESIMDDPSVGDRTGQWFWMMVTNLGLGSMTDRRFDQDYVDEVISRFLDREYAPDGRGGLFTVKDSGCDMRDVELWTQTMWFLDTII